MPPDEQCSFYLPCVGGTINPNKVFGPILNFASFRKDTAEDFFAGLSVMIMHQTPPDANQKVTEFEVWVKISENTFLFCELVDKPQLSIWDEPDDAEEPSTSSGSGSRREVTPGVTSSPQPPPPQMPEPKEETDLGALRENLE